MEQKIRVRIAPSPTGSLHIGTARTALFNYLFAKKNQGSFILRIEDTDLERSDPAFEKDIIDNLKWLGIEWVEGPDIEGKYGPYRQSERIESYTKYLKKLLAENKAYYCFCPEEELEAHRQYLMSVGQALVYSEKCRDLPENEVKKLLSQGKSAIIRFKVSSKKITFNDLIRNDLEFDGSLIGDISLAKNLTTPLYNFAVVIDDFEMEITHVIRGEDHISNTPKQILIQEALGFPRPQYAHLPLILGPDRSKLSKRHAAVSIAEYRKEGYLAETMVNFMSFLGWNPGEEREIYQMRALIKEFSLERVQKGGAVFNLKRLDFLNGFYIRQKPIEKITKLCVPYLIKAGFIEKSKNDKPGSNPSKNQETLKLPFKEAKFKIRETEEIINVETLQNIVLLYQERLKKLSEISELTDFFFKNKLKYDKELLIWKEMSDKDAKDSLDKLKKILDKIREGDWTRENLKNILMSETEKMENRGYVLWPFRVALTGKKSSAPPFEIAEILGKDKTLKRIKKAKELVE